jgi:multiple antibiotic resistance protein
MTEAATLFVSTFTTLLAIINPLESLPVFLGLLQGKDEQTHRQVARRACTYAMLLLFFFLIFGTLLLKIFEVPLSMVRIVGGIILMRIGFSLFAPSTSTSSITTTSPGADRDVAFVPLAMPLMFGPGAIATVIGMASLVDHPLAQILSLAAISIAILATMATTYLFLAYADRILRRIGPHGIDAATRIVGFFVAAMGMGLIFHGVTEATRTYLLAGTH